MRTEPKLIIAPIREAGCTSFDYRLCYVTIKLDAMQEANLVSVICQQTKEDLLPKMDSTSKQKTLLRFGWIQHRYI